jgi:hypothetical protein
MNGFGLDLKMGKCWAKLFSMVKAKYANVRLFYSTSPAT